jgi:hypothetical protein
MSDPVYLVHSVTKAPRRVEPVSKWASAGFELPHVGAPDRQTARDAAELMRILVERTYSIVRARLDEQNAVAQRPA